MTETSQNVPNVNIDKRGGGGITRQASGVTLLLVTVVFSWFLVLQYRGANDFTDTVAYMAQAKYLSGERQFNPARIFWEDFSAGTGNLNATMNYPGQVFSLTIGMISKMLNSPLEMWMILAFNFFVYLFCCIFCLLFLARHLRGWELFIIGFFSLTNYYVMCACVSTGTDALGFALLLFALWLSSLKKKRYFIIGIVFGISFFVRAHLAIFALFFPLLLFEKINKHAIRCTALCVLGIICAYGGVFGLLKAYVVPQPPPFSVVQYAQERGIPFDAPDNQEQNVTSDSNKSFSTFGWYSRQISESLPTLKQYGVGWVTFGAYKTLGPASWCFGPLFFVVLVSLLFKWSNPYLTRYTLYVAGTLVTFYCAAYMLLVPAPTEKMVGELMSLGRYFCYFFPLLLLVFWLLVRELVPPGLQFLPFLERAKQKIFGQTLDSRLFMTGVLLCLIFPTCVGYWGYGAALLAKMPVRQGTVVFQGDKILRQELSEFLPDSMVMSSRYFAVHVFSPIKNVVQSPASLDDFLQNKNNHLLDALILFPEDMGATIKMADSEKERWSEELEKDIIIDEQGNQFVKVCSHDGEGGSEDLRSRRTFVIYRRVGSLGFQHEHP
jgi:hypothetical protein